MARIKSFFVFEFGKGFYNEIIFEFEFGKRVKYEIYFLFDLKSGSLFMDYAFIFIA